MSIKRLNPQGDVLSSKCPSRSVLDHVTSTWGSLILMVLMEKTYRFSELRKRIGGISEKMLTQNLQELEHDGFVLRKAYPVIPPKVEYSLTPLGEEVAEHIGTLTKWVEQNLPQVLKNRARRSARAGSKRGPARS